MFTQSSWSSRFLVCSSLRFRFGATVAVWPLGTRGCSHWVRCGQARLRVGGVSEMCIEEWHAKLNWSWNTSHRFCVFLKTWRCYMIFGVLACSLFFFIHSFFAPFISSGAPWSSNFVAGTWNSRVLNSRESWFLRGSSLYPWPKATWSTGCFWFLLVKN